MSYWSHHPELLDEITIASLPEDWKEEVESGRAELEDVPEKIRDKAMLEGEREYWAGLADSARDQLKEQRLNTAGSAGGQLEARARALTEAIFSKEEEDDDPFESP